MASESVPPVARCISEVLSVPPRLLVLAFAGIFKRVRCSNSRRLSLVCNGCPQAQEKPSILQLAEERGRLRGVHGHGMKPRPLVSVGIPAYNRPTGLRRTLEQISRQTHSNLEILVSDNHSEDPSVGEVAQEFQSRDNRVRYYRQDQNLGILRNFQFLLGAATGEFFMWAADDDEWDRSFVETCVDTISGADLAMQDTYRTAYRKAGRVQIVKSCQLSPENSHFDNTMLFLKDGQPSMIYGLFRRTTLHSVVGQEDDIDLIDRLVLLRVTTHFRVRTFAGCLYTQGVDSDDYTAKPVRNSAGKLFRWRPLIAKGLYAIISSPQMSLRQKALVAQRFGFRTLYSFVQFERKYRPTQTALVHRLLQVGSYSQTLIGRLRGWRAPSRKVNHGHAGKVEKNYEPR